MAISWAPMLVVYGRHGAPPQGVPPVDPCCFRFIFPPVMKASDIRRGHVIMIDGQPSRVMDFTHRTPGNLRAFVQLRLRNLATGNTFDTRLAATEFVDEAPLETKEFQVLYADHGGVHVMDTTTYEQHTLDAEAVGDQAAWPQPEMQIQAEWLDGPPAGSGQPSGVEAPR